MSREKLFFVQPVAVEEEVHIASRIGYKGYAVLALTFHLRLCHPHWKRTEVGIVHSYVNGNINIC